MVSIIWKSPIFTPLRRCWQCGAMRHRFLAAGGDDLGIAIGDLLQAERHRAQAGAAQLVDAPGRALDGNAGVDRSLAGRVLALARGQDLAEDDLIDFLRLDLGTRSSRP